jgi:hypothetical protein
MTRLREAFGQLILDAVSARLTDQERQLRASLCASQIAGLAMTRYVWKVGAIASIPPDEVVKLVAPTIQRYLPGKITPRL